MLPPMPRLLDLAMFYPMFLVTECGYSDETWGEKVMTETQLVTRLPRQPIRALHVGCGQGELVTCLTQRWGDLGTFAGADLPEHIARARELSSRVGADVEWLESPLPDLGIPSESFNLVMLSGLERLPTDHWPRAMQESARVTMAGGCYSLGFIDRPAGPHICPWGSLAILHEAGISASPFAGPLENGHFWLFLGQKQEGEIRVVH